MFVSIFSLQWLCWVRAAVLVNQVGIAANTTVGLTGVVQLPCFQPCQRAGRVRWKNASAHGSAALVLGVHTSRHANRGWNAGQTVQMRGLV